MSALLNKPKVFAIGGAGIKIATRLAENTLVDFDILGVDLTPTTAPFEVFSLGGGTTEVFGSGGDPEVTLRTAQEKNAELEAKIIGTNQGSASNGLVFIIAGLGGGTASALAPIVASIALKSGAIVTVFATLPCSNEGNRRTSQARQALNELRGAGVTVVPLPNELYMRHAPTGCSMLESLTQTDIPIARGIRGLTGALYSQGLLEVDTEAVKKILCGRSAKTIFSLAEAEGSLPFGTLYNPLTDYPLLQSGEVARSADHLLLCLKISRDISLKEVNDFATQLCEKFGIRGEKIVSATIHNDWTEPRVEATLFAQPDPELRKKQAAAIQAAVKKPGKKTEEKPESIQTQFGFDTLLDQRGFFESSEPNIYRGEDVDVPTYLRRGVKIVL